MNENVRWIGISILLVILLLGSVSFLGPGVAPTGMISFNSLMSKITGRIVGLPDCRVSMNIGIPEAFTIYPGDTTDITFEVSDVKCGVTHASLTLIDFPAEYYSVTPDYHASLYPSETHKYVVHFYAPESDAGMFYIAKAKISGDNMMFYSNDFEVTVALLPEKPAKTAGAPVISDLVVTEANGEPGVEASPRAWWLISFISVITAISFVIYEYVPHTEK